MSLPLCRRAALAMRSGRKCVTRRRQGFTLSEVLMALAIVGVAMAITVPAVIEVLKRSQHAESAMEGAEELRYATALISQVVRSAPQPPRVQSGGLELLVAPKELGYATVADITWIDPLRDVKGSKSNQRVLKLTEVAGSMVITSVFGSLARPGGAVSGSDIETFFIDGSSLPAIDITAMFAVGDTISIPATPYGSATTGEINSISNNPGNKTITLTNNLGVDVPNGTRIVATSGRRLLFSVQSNGELRYHPDHRDAASYTVIARDIDPTPLADPSDTSSAETVPFSISGRNVTLNLQKLPGGTMAGRTVQGATTVIFARTDPLTL